MPEHLSLRALFGRFAPGPGPLRGRAAVLAGLLVLGLAPALSSAALVYSDVLLSVSAGAHDPFVDPLEHRPPDLLAARGNPTPLEALVQPSAWGRAPMSTSALAGGFASAAMSAAAVGGVGVSGYRRGAPNGSAYALFGQDITNTGTSARYLDLSWHIPAMEVSAADFDSFVGTFPSGWPEATVSARAVYTVLDASGQAVGSGTFLDVQARLLFINRDLDDIQFIETSSDLALTEEASCVQGQCVRSSFRSTVGPHEVSGYRWGPMDWNYLGLELLPGHTVAMNYTLFAGAYGGDPSIVDDNDISLQALIGDPFSVRDSGASFTVFERAEPPRPAQVPAPASACLVLLALGVMGGVGGGARRAAAATGVRGDRP